MGWCHDLAEAETAVLKILTLFIFASESQTVRVFSEHFKHTDIIIEMNLPLSGHNMKIHCICMRVLISGSLSLPIRVVHHVADKWLLQDTVAELGTEPWMPTTQCGLQHAHTFTEHVDVVIASHILLLSKLDLLTPLHWPVRGVESYCTYNTTFGNLAGPRA